MNDHYVVLQPVGMEAVYRRALAQCRGSTEAPQVVMDRVATIDVPPPSRPLLG